MFLQFFVSERTVITPYAICNQSQQLTQPPPAVTNHLQPSTSRNLPDVLSTKSSTATKSFTPKSTPTPSPTARTRTIPKPQTKVQQIAQSFANNPNFHITRSPTTNRKIPQYTIPSKLAASCSSKPDPTTTTNSDSDSDRSNSHSDHSGGSDITFKMDEIEYADA